MAKTAGISTQFVPTVADYTILDKVREMIGEDRYHSADQTGDGTPG